jgi:hypothetical protein
MPVLSTRRRVCSSLIRLLQQVLIK